MLYCSVFKQRFINKQLKNLTQIAGTTFKIGDVFYERNVTINAHFGASVYSTLQRNYEAEIDR